MRRVLQIQKLEWGFKKNLFGSGTFSSARLINSMSACIYKCCLRPHHLRGSERAKVASSYGAGAQELVRLRYVLHANIMNKQTSGEEEAITKYKGKYMPAVRFTAEIIIKGLR